MKNKKKTMLALLAFAVLATFLSEAASPLNRTRCCITCDGVKICAASVETVCGSCGGVGSVDLRD